MRRVCVSRYDPHAPLCVRSGGHYLRETHGFCGLESLISPKPLTSSEEASPEVPTPCANSSGGRHPASAKPRCQGRFSALRQRDRKSTRLNSSHGYISYAVFCLKKKT